MKEFLKNVLIGLGGLIGFIVAIAVVTIVGGGLWLILSALGLVGFGVIKFLGWLIAGAVVTIGGLWAIGWILNNSKNAK